MYFQVFKSMRSKRIHWFIFFSVLLTMLSGKDLSLAQSLAAVKDVNQPVRNVSPSASAQTDSSGGSSQYWHTYLWESLPSEWLQDSNQAALLEAYEQNSWKPLFITGGFEVKPSVHLLLQRLDNLQKEAIDPGPYNVDDLRHRIQKLEDLRLSLQAVDPTYRDSVADLSKSTATQQHSQAVSVSGAQYAMESSRLPAGGSDPTGERGKRYRDIFEAASAIDVRLAHVLIQFANIMNPYSKELQVNALLGHIPMDEFLKEIEPPSLQYQLLVQALQKYQHLAEKAPQQRLIQPQKLSLGDTGNSVRDLQKRLQRKISTTARLPALLTRPQRMRSNAFSSSITWTLTAKWGSKRESG